MKVLTSTFTDTHLHIHTDTLLKILSNINTPTVTGLKLELSITKIQKAMNVNVRAVEQSEFTLRNKLGLSGAKLSTASTSYSLAINLC